MKNSQKTCYEMVYSKNRRDIISSTDWMYADNQSDYEAAAVRVIYNSDGSISSKDQVIDKSLWTDVETPDYYSVAIEKRNLFN